MFPPSNLSQAATVSSLREVWLDGFRGWAILLVVFVHTGQAVAKFATGAPSSVLLDVSQFGRFGVALFFVISACTISLTLKAQFSAYDVNLASAASWLTRRFFRIAPLYYGAMGVYGVAMLLVNKPLGEAAELPGPIAYLLNFAFLHSMFPFAQSTVVPGGWSIGSEMMYYLVAPALFLLINGRSIHQAIAFALALFGILLSEFLLWNGLGSPAFVFAWFPNCLPTFIFGMMAYQLILKRGLETSAWKPRAALTAIALILSVLGCVAATSGDKGYVLSQSIEGLAFTILAYALANTDRNLMVNPLARLLGKYSYSIYLTHFLVNYAMQYIAARLHLDLSNHPNVMLLAWLSLLLSLTLPIAWLTYTFVEVPGIAYGRSKATAILASMHPEGSLAQ